MWGCGNSGNITQKHQGCPLHGTAIPWWGSEQAPLSTLRRQVVQGFVFLVIYIYICMECSILPIRSSVEISAVYFCHFTHLLPAVQSYKTSSFNTVSVIRLMISLLYGVYDTGYCYFMTDNHGVQLSPKLFPHAAKQLAAPWEFPSWFDRSKQFVSKQGLSKLNAPVSRSVGHQAPPPTLTWMAVFKQP